MAPRLEGCAASPPAQLDVSRLYLIRHAHAGDRLKWSGPDDARPLSEKGWRQARALVPLLAGEAFGAIASSPSLRCVQSVEPLATARHLAVEQDSRLLEGHDPDDTFAWLDTRLTSESLVACTHGDIVPAVLELAAQAGAGLPEERRWPKGSTWVLEHGERGWLRGQFLATPS